MGSNLLAIGSSVCKSLDEEKNGIHAALPSLRSRKHLVILVARSSLKGYLQAEEIPPLHACDKLSMNYIKKKKKHNVAAKYCLIEITVV